MKPIVGIVGRPGKSINDSDIISAEEQCKNSIILSGGIPFVILPLQSIIYNNTSSKDLPYLTDSEKDDLNKILNMCDAILIPGGYRLYEYDYYICKYAFDNNIPLLGICAGMQAMSRVGYDNKNVLIDDDNSHNIERKYAHDIIINKESLLYKIIGKELIKVNSYHKYKIECEGINNICATSTDGKVIEAISNDNVKFFLGVQWHPEKLFDIDENSKKIFKFFIDSAKK